MAFSDFEYPQVIRDLGLTEQFAELLPGVEPVTPHLFAAVASAGGVILATSANTEKARSERIVAPVLGDLWHQLDRRINLHSGVEFSGDPDANLVGVCDFLIGRTPQLPHIVAPVIVIFEAKRDSIPGGYGQCIAGMVGVQRYNRREEREIDPVYGCVTTGSLWQFLRLSQSTVTIDTTEYGISQIDRILGVLKAILS